MNAKTRKWQCLKTETTNPNQKRKKNHNKKRYSCMTWMTCGKAVQSWTECQCCSVHSCHLFTPQCADL